MNSNLDSYIATECSGKSFLKRFRFGLGLIFIGLYWPLAVLLITFMSLISYPFLNKGRHRKLGQWVLRCALGRFVDTLEVIGILRVCDQDLVGRVDVEGPMIIACNHPALWDAPIVLRRFGGLSGIMKSEALSNPFLCVGARFAGFLPNEPRVRMVKMALNRLKGGGKLLFFPEGTRTRKENGVLNPFRPGLALLEKRSGVPILPILISSDSRYLEKGWPIWKMPNIPVSVTLRMAEPVVIGDEESVRDFSTRLEKVFRDGLS